MRRPASPTVQPRPPAGAALEAVDPAWAWAPYEPSVERPWTIALASHLFRRAGFGANGAELDRALSQGPRGTIDRLLDPLAAATATDPALAEHESAAARSGDAQALSAWWIRRLFETRDPLGERLTLFWHQHFAIGAAATANLALYHQHLQRLRSGARGRFSALLESLLDDPAMYIALHGEHNRRANPNLDFARPWIEDFTTGPGVAGDPDIRDLARALTGWFVYGGRLRLISREQDADPKTIFGQSGSFSREELARLLANQPATADHLARKLFRWFVAEGTPPPLALLSPLADLLRHGRTINEVTGKILCSNLFFSDHALHQKVKSPVELLVGLAKALETTPSTLTLAKDAAALGQRLDEPPTLAGWPGGAAWINTITVSTRLRCCRSLIEGTDGYTQGADPGQVARNHGRIRQDEAARFWLALMLGDDRSPNSQAGAQEPGANFPTDPAAGRQFLDVLVARPQFQLA